MATIKTKEIIWLNAYFTPEGFLIDDLYEPVDTLKTWKEAFDNDKYKTLFHLGFINKEN